MAELPLQPAVVLAAVTRIAADARQASRGRRGGGVQRLEAPEEFFRWVDRFLSRDTGR